MDAFAEVADVAVKQEHPDTEDRGANVTALNLTIITPVARPGARDRLMKLDKCMRWDLVMEWILVYDTSQLVDLEPYFVKNPKVTELYFQGADITVAGHKRNRGYYNYNRGLQNVRHGLVYFLDDDNVVHPNFWHIMTNSLLGHIVTFDQLRNPSLLDLVTPGHEVFKGDNVVAGHIDTAMFVVDRGIIGAHRFQEDVTWGDFLFIDKLLQNNSDKHIYIPEVAAYYNYIGQRKQYSTFMV